jgi:hypothetical protein
VECLFQALDEIDDLVAMLRQRWLPHGVARPVIEPPHGAT